MGRVGVCLVFRGEARVRTKGWRIMSDIQIWAEEHRHRFRVRVEFLPAIPHPPPFSSLFFHRSAPGTCRLNATHMGSVR